MIIPTICDKCKGDPGYNWIEVREVFMVPVPGEGGGLHIRKQRLYCCKECMLKGETHQQ